MASGSSTSANENQNARLKRLTLRKKEKDEKREKAQKKLFKELREELSPSRRSSSPDSPLTSSPPKDAEKKQEYVRTTGCGHEAIGDRDSGGDGRNRKNDHGGGGGGSGGGGKKKFVFCEKCQDFIDSEEFVKHLREEHYILP